MIQHTPLQQPRHASNPACRDPRRTPPHGITDYLPLLTHPKLGDAFVYVCTIQRMAINLLGGEGAITINDEQVDVDAEQLNIPIHAFDLIIADECHRGYSAKYYSPGFALGGMVGALSSRKGGSRRRLR